MTTIETMRAYHGDPALKAKVLAQMADHRAAERLIKGTYWDWTIGRGCAVGCLTHDPDGGHAEYPVRWGIPEELAGLEDSIFEHLPLEDALGWPERFLAAIEPGVDLSGVDAAFALAEEREVHPWAVWAADQLIASIKAATVAVLAAESERVSR